MSTEQQQQQTIIAKKNKKHSGRGKASKKIAPDPYDSVYGRVPWEMFRGRPWTYAGKLEESMVGNDVLLLGNVMRVQPMGKTSTIVVLYSRCRTVLCKVVATSPDEGPVTTRMVHFAATMRRGTYVDIEGLVTLPGNGIKTDHLLGMIIQPVEILVRKLHTIATNKDGSPVDGVTTVDSSD